MTAKVFILADHRRTQPNVVTAQAVAAPWIAIGAATFVFGCAMTLAYAESVATLMNAGRRR